MALELSFCDSVNADGKVGVKLYRMSESENERLRVVFLASVDDLRFQRFLPKTRRPDVD